jgi:SAM-dependent MidA family methyltransferase
MGSSTTPTSAAISPIFARVFRAQVGTRAAMTFAEFMALALYDPEVGYYSRPKPRVGYAPGTDFFTASTSGPIFGELIAAACQKLLGSRNPREFTFVELGAETAGGVLAGVAHPFGSARTMQLGSSLQLQGNCVIFSNELFDAQPFHRFVFRRGAWRELGVALREEILAEVELASATPANLPASAPESYVIDAPFAASTLLDQIAAQPWTGLFIACDYGKSWAELTRRHRPSLLPSYSVQRPSRSTRRTGSHLPYLLGLARGEARRPSFHDAARRVPRNISHPPRRRFYRRHLARGSSPL